MVYKLLSFLFVLSCFGQLSFAEEQADEIYKVDVLQSSVIWKGSKFNSAHSGKVSIKQGLLIFNRGKLAKGEFTIDMRSIKNTDIQNLNQGRKLEEHLKSPDFFEVDKHPESKFIFDKVTELGSGEYSLNGEMNLKGKVQSETFTAKINAVGSKAVAVSKVSLNRTKYGIVYGSESESTDWFFVKWYKYYADKFIKNNIDLTINVVADRESKSL